jgi:alkylation response protein AidB-like acyl-CoA dehydrogenase
MAYAPDATDLALAENVARIAHGEFADLDARWERDPSCGAEALRRLAAHHLLGLNLPPEHGGQGLTHFQAALCLEEMAKVSPDCALLMAASSLGQSYYIKDFGTDAHRARYLPRICAGDFTVAIGITEPGAGTAATAMTTRIRRDGDRLIINGRKHYVSNAGQAGLFVIYGRMSDAPGAKGIGAVLVERDTPGFSIDRLSENMAGGHQADLLFEDCTIPADRMLVGPGGFARLTHCYNLERLGGAACMLGIAQGAFDRALAHVQERQQFGRALVEFQAVQLKLADMAMPLEAARLMIHRALARDPSGYPTPMDASMCKVFTLETARMVTDTAIQLLGGAGYLKEGGVERRYRYVRGFAIAGGPLDIHRTMIAGWLAGRRFSQWAPGGRE